MKGNTFFFNKQAAAHPEENEVLWNIVLAGLYFEDFGWVSLSREILVFVDCLPSWLDYCLCAVTLFQGFLLIFVNTFQFWLKWDCNNRHFIKSKKQLCVYLECISQIFNGAQFFPIKIVQKMKHFVSTYWAIMLGFVYVSSIISALHRSYYSAVSTTQSALLVVKLLILAGQRPLGGSSQQCQLCSYQLA